MPIQSYMLEDLTLLRQPWIARIDQHNTSTGSRKLRLDSRSQAMVRKVSMSPAVLVLQSSFVAAESSVTQSTLCLGACARGRRSFMVPTTFKRLLQRPRARHVVRRKAASVGLTGGNCDPSDADPALSILRECISLASRPHRGHGCPSHRPGIWRTSGPFRTK